MNVNKVIKRQLMITISQSYIELKTGFVRRSFKINLIVQESFICRRIEESAPDQNTISVNSATFYFTGMLLNQFRSCVS